MWVEVTLVGGHPICVNLDHIEGVRPASTQNGDPPGAKCVLDRNSGHAYEVLDDYAHMRALVMR